MALKVKKDRVLPYKVTARMLDDEKGEPVDVKFTIHYKPLTRSEYREQMRKVSGGDDSLSPRENMQRMFSKDEIDKYDAWVRAHVVGWGEDVTDEEGEPLPFTDENYAALMEIMSVATAIDRGLMDCSMEEPAKN